MHPYNNLPFRLVSLASSLGLAASSLGGKVRQSLLAIINYNYIMIISYAPDRAVFSAAVNN